jgi:hypothetical protein
MNQKHYRAGDILFAEDEASDYACRILSGEVEIVKRNDGEAVNLGTAAAGEFVGELGVILDSPRIATVRAAGPVTVEVIPKDEFLRRISEDSELAFRLLSRLGTRLKVISQALVDTVALGGGRAVGRPSGDGAPTPLPALRVFADSNRLGRLLPSEGVPVAVVPFVVGRVSKGGDRAFQRPADLALDDVKPFRLSRVHFSIDHVGGRYMVRDMHSSLGTEVNGTGLGDHFASDQALLGDGDNVVVAGGKDSAFRFRLVVGA